MHNLDTCDLFLAPPPVDADASAAGAAGEGTVSSVGDFPPAESSYNFLAAHLEGWRRLECDEESLSGASLSGLPQGLAVLSLQVQSRLYWNMLQDPDTALMARIYRTQAPRLYPRDIVC